MPTRRLFLTLLLPLVWATALPAQDFLDLQQSPAASGLFSAQQDGEYLATGISNGQTYLINAEGGDRLSVLVRTVLRTSSFPRIRVANAGGTALAETTGTSEGTASIDNFEVPSPGVYQVTIYSNNNASAFGLQALLGRGIELEREDNNLRPLANAMSAHSQGGGFTAALAGVLDHDEDWHDLGSLAPGNTVDFSLETPAASTLDGSAVELALFRDDEPAPRATAVGSSLSHAVTTAGRYRIRIRMNGLEGRHLTFTGGADHVNLGNPEALRINGSQTIEFWIKPDNFNSRQNPYAKAYGGEER